MHAGERPCMRFCGYCAGELSRWPGVCSSCGREHFRNPAPVVVVLLPIDEGVLLIRRAIPPGKDKLALPGGFMDWSERWQESGARELREETGIVIDPDELRLLGAESVPGGYLLLFAQARTRGRDQVAWTHDPSEVAEVLVVHEPVELAFPTHTQYLRAYFEARAAVRG